MLKALSATQKQVDLVKLHEQAKRNLEEEIQNYKDEAQKQRKIIFQLEKERDRYINEASDLTQKVGPSMDCGWMVYSDACLWLACRCRTCPGADPGQIVDQTILLFTPLSFLPFPPFPVASFPLLSPCYAATTTGLHPVSGAILSQLCSLPASVLDALLTSEDRS